MKSMIYFLPLTVTEGPVEIGMSLDIASIDAISEINMVRASARPSPAPGPGMRESKTSDGKLAHE